MGLREDSVVCKYCDFYNINEKECHYVEWRYGCGCGEKRSPTFCCIHFKLPGLDFFRREDKRDDGSLILALYDVPEKEKRLAQMEKAVNQEVQKDSQGCYIATSVYGSYDCPQVWALRRYRDNVLANSVWGRVFIRIYYALSPKIVRLFGGKEWFSRFWRTKLDKIIAGLHRQGIEDTPYNDD